ncbi:EexN family lipoprotein [Deefgea salmonis]|uniref:EexN family lipoprotein n=1 Tax=Deefgea salmonis TaxID=2875502 RepID=A0ABS8BIK6_9NEIS|nr:EexN family lipoprotein [Deefgea salmonis]
MRYIFVFITLVGTALCFAESSSHDVNYWMKSENKEELSKTIEKCSNDPAKYSANADCINAKEAKKKLFKKNFLSN